MTNQDDPNINPLALKLQNEVDETSWVELQPHFDRGALVFISADLDFIDVAVKVIQDDVEEIKVWSDEKLIYNPSESDIEVDKSIKYKFIITQPYVLIQPVLTKAEE